MHQAYSAPAPFVPTGCANCGAPRHGDYCHLCGQHYLDGRPTVGGILMEFLTRSLSLESGLFHTFVQLSVRPGRMIRDYVRGKRQRLTHPVGYLMLSAAAAAAVWPMRERSFVASAARGMADADDLLNQAFLQVITGFETHSVFSTLLICCFFVPLQRILFGGQITTAESFVYALFLFGHVLMIESLSTPVAALASSNPSGVLDYTTPAVLLYLVIASAVGYFGPRLSTFIKTATIIVCAFVGLALTVVIAVVGWYLVLVVAHGATG